MRLDKLSINGFGKFDKNEIAFTRGLNVIYGPNESGKTTLQDYIVAMLYHLDKNKRNNRYIPWKTGEFGSVNKLYYTLDSGEAYTIEKNFNRSTTRVFSAEPYEEITERFPVIKKDILVMEEHTGLNLHSFESTALIKQAGVQFDKKHSTDIVERLVRISEYGDENVDFKNAIAYLDNISSEIGGGNAGKYKKLVKVNALIEELECEKQDAEMNIARVRNLSIRINELKVKKRELESSINDLELLKAHKNQKLHNYSNELRDRLKVLEDKKNEIMLQLPMYTRVLGKDISKDYLKEVEEYYSLYKFYEKQLSEVDFYTVQNTNNDNGNNIGKTLKKSTPRLGFIHYLTALIPLLASGFLSFTRLIKLNWIVLTGAISIGFIILFLSIFIKKKELNNQSRNIKLRSNNQQSVIKNKLEEAAEGIKSKLGKIGFEINESDMIHPVFHEFKRVFETGDSLNRDFDEVQKEINLINNNLSLASNSFAGINQNGVGGNKFTQSINDKEIERVLNHCGLTYEYSVLEIDSLLQINISKLRNVEVEESSLQKEVEMLSSKYRHPGDIENLLSLARNEKKEYEITREAAILAKEFLALALKEIQQDYIPALNKRMGEVLSKITDDKYKNVDTSLNLDIIINDSEFGTIAPGLLSKGTIDQVYFSLRFASAELLSSKEKLPLIIDEPFAHYDDTRLENVLRFLSKISKDTQVILFTCQERELEILRGFSLEDVNILML